MKLLSEQEAEAANPLTQFTKDKLSKEKFITDITALHLEKKDAVQRDLAAEVDPTKSEGCADHENTSSKEDAEYSN
jgi:hypothetical protein